MKNFALIVYENDEADVQLCSSMFEVGEAISSVKNAGVTPLCVVDTARLFHTWLVQDQSNYFESVLKVIKEKVFPES